MHIFVYEFTTGGGRLAIDQDPGDRSWQSLVREGRAMSAAITADLAAIPGVVVHTMLDVCLRGFHDAVDSRVGGVGPPTRVHRVSSLAQHYATIERLASSADWTLLIAPESAGILAETHRTALRAGGRMLSPPLALIELASNKQRTAEHLAAAGISVPSGFVLPANEPLPANLPYPVVQKPLDGCGSQGMRRIDGPGDWRAATAPEPTRIEAFVPGIAASVAVLCGPAGCYPLPACEQLLSTDGRFTYRGGRTPLPQPQRERAERLALAAIGSLDRPFGYIGVDLVLGRDASGEGDRLIEINPRLTTSYVGLRALSQANLAAAMLDVAVGREPDLRFASGPLEFTASGEILGP